MASFRIRLRSFVISALFATVAPTVSPVTATAQGSVSGLFGVTNGSPTNLVQIDPATGQQRVVTTVSPSGSFALLELAIALDPASHTVFLLRFSPFPEQELLSVNDQSGALSAVALGIRVIQQLVFDSGSGSLFGITYCCPTNLVQIDPATGQQTVVTTVPNPRSGFAEVEFAIALDPASHTVFLLRSTANPDQRVQMSELLSVNDQSGALSAVDLDGRVSQLAFDSGSGSLFGIGTTSPNANSTARYLVQIDPATGQQTVVTRVSSISGSAIALDPASHTVFLLRSTNSPVVQELLSVNDQSGALSAATLDTPIFLLAFDRPAITPESIKADVLQAAATGAIVKRRLANSLLAKLNKAASARADGDCATAANVYQAFVHELQAQSGKGVNAATAATLVDEALFLAANCQRREDEDDQDQDQQHDHGGHGRRAHHRHGTTR